MQRRTILSVYVFVSSPAFSLAFICPSAAHSSNLLLSSPSVSLPACSNCNCTLLSASAFFPRTLLDSLCIFWMFCTVCSCAASIAWPRSTHTSHIALHHAHTTDWCTTDCCITRNITHVASHTWHYRRATVILAAATTGQGAWQGGVAGGVARRGPAWCATCPPQWARYGTVHCRPDGSGKGTPWNGTQQGTAWRSAAVATAWWLPLGCSR